MKTSKFLKIILLIFLFTFFIFITIKTYANSVFDNLSNNIFRLHILANSNTNEDQQLKLKVRDEIIKYMEELTKNCKSKSEVIEIVNSNLENFKQIAKETIEKNGYSYDVTVEIGNFYFPTKYYANISMPSGFYDALKIKIGKAEGENWWCSLFPPLCFTDISSGVIDEKSNKTLKNNLEKEEYSIITSDSEPFKFKFKIIELFNF